MGRRDIDDLPDSCPYKTWSLGDLMAECKRRGIAASGGLVSRVIKRLMRDDAARAAGKQSVSKPHVRGPPRQKRAPGDAPSGRGRKKRVANPLLARRVWTVFERWQEERVHRLREEVGWQAGVTGAAWERARRAYARQMVRDARDALPPPLEPNAEAEAEADAKEEERRALMDPAVQAGFERAMLARIPVHHYAHVIAAPPPLPMQSPEHWLMSLGNAPYLSEMAVASVTDFLIYWREGLLRWAEEATGSATSKDQGEKDKEMMEEQEQEQEDQDEEDEQEEEDEEKPRPADDLNVPLMIPAPPRLRRIARAPSVRERVEGLIKLVGVLGVIAESRASRALDHGASRVRWESVKGSVLGEAARLHLPVPQPGQTPAMWLEEVGRQRQVPSDVLEGFLRGWKDRVVRCLKEGGAVEMAERREGGVMGGVGGEGVKGGGAVGNGNGGGFGEGHARANGVPEVADSDVEMEDVSEDARKEEEGEDEEEEETAEEPEEDDDMDETMEEDEESMDVDQQPSEQPPAEAQESSEEPTQQQYTNVHKKNPTPSPPPAALKREQHAPPQTAQQHIQDDDDDAEDSIVVARPPSPPPLASAPPTLPPPPPPPPASSTLTTTPTTRKSTAAGRRRSGRRSAMG